MDKREGRFTNTEKRIKVGTEIYKKLIDQMLVVHIAHMERKMRACLQCAPRCTPAQGKLRSNPYTRPFKKKKWVDRTMLPSYLQQRIRERERERGGRIGPGEEERDRRRFEGLELDLRENQGDIDLARRRIEETYLPHS